MTLRHFLLLSYCIFSLLAIKGYSRLKYKKDINQSFAFKGKIIGIDTGKVFLLADDGSSIDSCRLRNGQFEFNGEIKICIRYFLFLNKLNNVKNSSEIYLAPSAMYIVAHYNAFDKLRMWGSNTQDELVALRKSEDIYYERLVSLAEQMPRIANVDTFNVKSVLLKEYAHHIAHLDSIYIVRHPNSHLSLYLLMDYLESNQICYSKSIDAFLLKVPKKYQDNYPYTEITQKILYASRHKIGEKVPNIKLWLIDGKVLHLKDLASENKYTLIEFGASWCLPCREQNTILKEIFLKNKDNGFNIISIYSREKIEDVSKAILQDSTAMWYNVIDNDAQYSDSSHMFTFNTIPISFLIDSSMNLIGVYTVMGSFEEKDITTLSAQLSSLLSEGGP